LGSSNLELTKYGEFGEARSNLNRSWGIVLYVFTILLPDSWKAIMVMIFALAVSFGSFNL
jgi:hypothetical protein